MAHQTGCFRGALVRHDFQADSANADTSMVLLPAERPASTVHRRTLWGALVLLVVALITLVVWLAGIYEANQVQAQLERDVAEAVGDVRAFFAHNAQGLQALQY